MDITLRHRNQLELYINWIKGINPLFKLREDSEIPVLASLVLLYHAHLEKGYPIDTLNSLLFSEDTKLSICSKLGISERSFNKTLKSLEDKEIIKDDNLNPFVVPTGGFKITYYFGEAAVDDVQFGV